MEESSAVMTWWYSLSGIGVFNLILFIFVYRLFKKRSADYPADIFKYRQWSLYMAAIYTAVCAFRSFFPRGDVQRVVIVDHWISAVAIGRTAATIAETALIIQLALILYEIGKNLDKNKKLFFTFSKILVPIVIVAEIFSWYACLTGNSMGTILEESLWGVMAAIGAVGFIAAFPHYTGWQKKALGLGIFFAGGCAIYLAFVDVPAYVSKYIADTEAGRVYSPVMQGFVEVATQWRYTRAYEDWQYAMWWMTLYFSIAVWMSMTLVNAPRFDKGLKGKQ